MFELSVEDPVFYVYFIVVACCLLFVLHSRILFNLAASHSHTTETTATVRCHLLPNF